MASTQERYDDARLSTGALQPLWWLRTAVHLVRVAAPLEFGCIVASEMASAAALFTQLFAASHIFAHITSHERLSSLWPWALLAIGSLILQFASSAAGRELGTVAGELVSREALQRVLGVTSGAELDDFEDPHFFDRVARAVTAAEHRPWQLAQGVVQFVRGAAGLVVVTLVLAHLSIVLAALSLVTLPPFIVAAKLNSRAYYDSLYSLTRPDRIRQFLATALTDRVHAADIRSFGLAPYLQQRYDELYEDRIKLLRWVVSRRIRGSVIASVFTTAALLAPMAAAVTLQRDGTLTLAQLGVAGLALGQAVAMAGSVLASAAQLYECALFLQDYSTFIDVEVPGPPAEQAVAPPLAPAVVRLLEVGYRYPCSDRSAVAGVSLQLEPGQLVGLVGANGSGKTSVARLLAGLLTPSAGQIAWGELDYAEWSEARVRRSVAMLSQDAVLWPEPLSRNVWLGQVDEPLDQSRLDESIEQAGLGDLVASLRDGPQTELGKTFGGEELSVGEWQRVALARALYRRSAMLILDEPTSALDPVVEARLTRNLRALANGRIVVVISHRLSVVRNCDVIHVLEGGRVVESGTPDALAASSGRYARMLSAQSLAPKAEASG